MQAIAERIRVQCCSCKALSQGFGKALSEIFYRGTVRTYSRDVMSFCQPKSGIFKVNRALWSGIL